jgi:hypothetical protein
MTLPTYSIYWDLPIMIVVVSLVYSATRYDDWGAIVHEAVRWGLRMAAFLGGIGLALYMLGWWVEAGASWWVLAAVGGAAALALGGPLFARPKRRSEI